MRIATSAETAKNTRAVASHRSIRRTSLGSAGACVLPIDRLWVSDCNQITSRLKGICLGNLGCSHIIDKKD
jgi:hypothetical protein